MKNREEMIEKLVEHRVDCFDFRDLADLFIGGLKGYDEKTDEELIEEYDLYFESEEKWEMIFIQKTEIYNTGGGCLVDVLSLNNGKVLVLSDEYVGLYHSLDEMLEDDGEKCLNGFYI